MKLTKFLRAFACIAVLGSTITMTVSCKEDEGNQVTEVGTITGTITDIDTGAPIAGVAVAVSGSDATATTGSDGRYTVTNVTMERHAVSFSKASYLTTSVTVTAAKFDANKQFVIDVSLRYAAASITGTVTDATSGNAPLAGVTVDIGPAGSATTGANGQYTIENLVVEEYTATFSKSGYPSVTKKVTPNDFVNSVAIIDMEMGLEKLLPGKTALELREAKKWYYNDYRGGRNGNGLDNDWSLDYLLSVADFYGNVEEQNEGSCLRIRNEPADQANPANLNDFDTYMYGSKLITNENKYFTVSVRTHQGTEAAPVYFGVQVVDLNAAAPAAVKVGPTETHFGDAYKQHTVDLSAYVGKEIIIAMGVYRAQTGDYWKQMPIRRIIFTPTAAPDIANPHTDGTEVVGLEGWKLTQEMVRSTMANPKKSFTGISPVTGNRDNYMQAYSLWRDIDHVATNWEFVRNPKDPEPFVGEGFVIKTRGSGTPVSTTVPEAYFYAKFAITAENDHLTLKTRNFSSNYTFFKLTAIKEDGTFSHLTPISNTADDASAATDGCWKFKHEKGNDNDQYASFVYDLSSFTGNNVVLCLGVYKGENNGDESKLVIYKIDLD
jgi:hypothetical protein